MKKKVVLVFSFFLVVHLFFPEPCCSQNTPNAEEYNERANTSITVAAVQMHSLHTMEENVIKICNYIEDCANEGASVVVFPECATTGYFKDEISAYTKEDYESAENEIAKACSTNNVYAVFGTPYFEEGELYNMGIVINNEGITIYRQPKIHLVGGDKPWAQPGNRSGVFSIDSNLCSILICHDSRYPELVRLPVIKGSRLVFYISSESNVLEEHKLAPYRAQVVARAVENNVFIVQANTPQRIDPLEGSHGQSRFVDPDGILISEASVFTEEVLIETLNLGKASRKNATRSLEAPFLKEWWDKGLMKVKLYE